MALNLDPPFVPGVDEFDVLDLDELAGGPLVTSIQLVNAPFGYWLHPHWRGTSRDGVATDVTTPATQVFDPNERVNVIITEENLSAIEQGHALYSYTLQAQEDYQPGYEDSRRKYILIGKRYFPGAGLNVAVIQQSNRLQFDLADLGEGGANVTVLPWQAMAADDRLIMTWRGFRSTGAAAPVVTQVMDIGESDIGFPIMFTIPVNSIRPIVGGFAFLSYEIEYASTGVARPGPVQRFTIEPAASDYLPPLTIVGHTGGEIDPALHAAAMTFSIQPFAELVEGDVLLIYVEDVLTGVSEPLGGARLDQSAVDSGRLQCTVMADWLQAYLERDIRLTYHMARPRLDRASEPLSLRVRAAMHLPMPVVQGASGAGQERGEFKAQDTGAGIKVWVPGLAVYPANAAILMHWEGPASAGSYVKREPTGDTPPAFIIPPEVVAPNIGKDVRVFYRVMVPNEAARDSQVFTLKVLPLPEHAYPTLQCVHAPNGVMSLASVPQAGSTQTLARWALIAIGQRILLTATGTSKLGVATTETLMDNVAVTSSHVSNGVTVLLRLDWLRSLQIGTSITFTVRVSADEGQSYAVFPRVYITLQA